MNGHILPGTSIAVDFWKIKGRQDVLIHFLTHVHGDHIVGLTSSWTRPIYCSDFTANILEAHYGIPKCLLKTIPLNQPTHVQIPNSTDSFCVTAFDANHCPGAVMFYFQGNFGNILNTGDFRFSCEIMSENLQGLCGKIDKLYFDNTFCSEECVFPVQEECLEQIIEIIKKHSNFDVLIGVRKLGKESMLAKIGVALNETIFVSPERLNISQCLFDCNVFSAPTKDQVGRIRTVPLHTISRALLYQLNQLTPTIAILPTAIFTGLSCRPFCRDLNIYVVPYSDHSSFPELVQFVRELQPGDLIPIVRSSRGPFGTDISNRSNMMWFRSYLDADITAKSQLSKSDVCSSDFNGEAGEFGDENHAQGENFSVDSRGFLIRSCLDSCELANKKLKKFLSFNSNSNCENRLIPVSTIKRKCSFHDKRKKKIAKGVIFQEEPFEEPCLSSQTNIFHSANAKMSSLDCMQFPEDTLENLLALADSESFSFGEEVKVASESSDIKFEYNCNIRNYHIADFNVSCAHKESECKDLSCGTSDSVSYKIPSTTSSCRPLHNSDEESLSSHCANSELILHKTTVREESECAGEEELQRKVTNIEQYTRESAKAGERGENSEQEELSNGSEEMFSSECAQAILRLHQHSGLDKFKSVSNPCRESFLSKCDLRAKVNRPKSYCRTDSSLNSGNDAGKKTTVLELLKTRHFLHFKKSLLDLDTHQLYCKAVKKLM